MREKTRARVGGGLRQRVNYFQSLDGRSFPEGVNDRIDRTVFLALGNANGRELLAFLESITLRTVMPVTASDGDLRDMEGQRRLVAMLKQRLQRATTKEKV